MTNKLRQRLVRAGRKGFTLVETLVAVLILAMAIAGPLTIASKGLTTSLVAKDQTTAYYLAQDAVEYARFARDTNRLGSADWIAGSGSGSTDLAPCEAATGCYFDSLSNSPTAPTQCPSGGCPVLYWDPTNLYFTYSTNAPNTPTIFTRTVAITTPVGTNSGEALLTVTVSWSDTAGLTRKVTLVENLYNWQ